MSDVFPSYRPRCRNFCSKAMMVYGEAFESDPDYQANQSDAWCNQTCKEQGPDGEAVTLDLCSNPARRCFEEY